VVISSKGKQALRKLNSGWGAIIKAFLLSKYSDFGRYIFFILRILDDCSIGSGRTKKKKEDMWELVKGGNLGYSLAKS
jgi:hypothetical protein